MSRSHVNHIDCSSTESWMTFIQHKSANLSRLWSVTPVAVIAKGSFEWGALVNHETDWSFSSPNVINRNAGAIMTYTHCSWSTEDAPTIVVVDTTEQFWMRWGSPSRYCIFAAASLEATCFVPVNHAQYPPDWPSFFSSLVLTPTAACGFCVSTSCTNTLRRL